MTRDHLVGMLDHDGEAFAACREALAAGADFWVAEHAGPASSLVDIYSRRDRHAQQRGTPTLGFTQAVDELRSRGDDLVRIGAVDTDDPPYHFQLFLNEDATAVIACLGVDQSCNPNRHPRPTAAVANDSVRDEFPDPRQRRRVDGSLGSQ